MPAMNRVLMSGLVEEDRTLPERIRGLQARQALGETSPGVMLDGQGNTAIRLLLHTQPTIWLLAPEPVLSSVPEEQEPAGATSSTTSTGRPPATTPSLLGGLERLLRDPPHGEGRDDPWLEAARELVNAASRRPTTPNDAAGATPAAPADDVRVDSPHLPQPREPGTADAGMEPSCDLDSKPSWDGLQYRSSSMECGNDAATLDYAIPTVDCDFADPPAWPGWQYRRQWVTAVRRWNKTTDIPVGRRAEKVLRTLGWEMMTEFEHLSEAQLSSPDYLEHLLRVIEMRAGVREDDDRRAAFRGVLYDNARRRDESLGQYANRRLRDFSKASSYGVQLPAEFRSALLREGAGLSEQGQQNLTALLQGSDNDVDKIAHTLARMDVRSDRLSGFCREEHVGEHAESYHVDGEEGDDDDEEDDPLRDEDDSAEDQEILDELSDMNFTREQAALVFAIMENRPPRQRRTWRENKKFKAELRKDRQSFTKGGTSDSKPDHMRGGYRPGGARAKISREQLKRVSKCNLCGKRGHWAEDCRSGQGGSRPSNGVVGNKMSGFCYLGGSLAGASSGKASHFTFMTYVRPSTMVDPSLSWNFLAIPSGMAILDIGATQDIIGKSAFEALERELDRCGLKSLEIPTTASALTGIGGAARVAKTALVPISPGGVPGVIQFLVIDGEVPPLLSVRLRNIDVNLRMTSLPSGHRAIPLVQWTGGAFPVPEIARRQYGLEEGESGVTVQFKFRPVNMSVQTRSGVKYLLPAIRANYSRLALAETRQKSVLSERKKFLTANVQEPMKCMPAPWEPHPPGEPVRLVDSVSEMRSSLDVYTTPGTTATVPEETIPAELNATLQAMAASFREVGQSLRDLARGQGQMLTMMQGHIPESVTEMSLQQVAEAAERTADLDTDMTWPSWVALPMLSLSSSLISWHQISHGMKDRLATLGADDRSWMVYIPDTVTAKIDKREPSETLPWLRWPWIRQQAGEVPTPRTEVALWHEVWREDQLWSRGVGEPPPDLEGSATTKWTCPRHLRLLHECAESPDRCLGVREDGAESHLGPFWLVQAPRLQQLIEAVVYPDLDPETAGAEDAMIKMITQQRREGQPSQVDLVELFESSQVSQFALQEGVRVTSQHETFTTQHGWKPEEKERRQRCRKNYQNSGRSIEYPIRSYQNLERSVEYPIRNYQNLKRSVEYPIRSYAIVDGHRSFYLEASTLDPVWTSDEWSRISRSQKAIRFFTVTNASSPPPLGRQTGTPSAKERSWPIIYEDKKITPSPPAFAFFSVLHGRSRGSEEDRSRAQESTKCWASTYGKFGGLTLSTYKLRHTTMYLNRFMTAHGAEGGRSSISVTRDARVLPHRDVNNVGLNYSMAIGSFKGGDLWVEHPEGDIKKCVGPGDTRLGRVYKHRNKMNVFDPKSFHAVDQWEGERWSITAFQSRSSMQLPPDQRAHLEELGFSTLGYEGDPLSGSSAARAISRAVRSEVLGITANYAFASHTSVDEIEAETDEEQPSGPEQRPTEGAPEPEQKAIVTESQKKLIHRVHVNTGHPPKERFLRTLRAAGALPHVLRYVRDDFHCEACAAKRGPDHRRRAQCPRVHSFNRVLSMDVFYIHYRGESIPILNAVCHGTNFQMAQRIDGSGTRTPSAAATWRTFVTTWVRFMGPPSLIITDGGKEFQGRCERGVEQLGILHHITAPESPWQNSRAERHGWLKQRITQELDSGMGIVENLHDIDELLAAVVSAKNRWFNSGGYTPVQLVYGELPRVPGELLSDNNNGQQVISDGFYDPAGMDEAGAEFRKSAAIRERGRQLALAETSKEAIKRALSTSSTPLRSWSPGQWVGPGLVILQSRSVVYVAMRSRLWRCAPEQLRAAFPSEVLGRHLATDPEMAELLRQVMSGSSAGAVDVAREGPPEPAEQCAPVQHEAEGEAEKMPALISSRGHPHRISEGRQDADAGNQKASSAGPTHVLEALDRGRRAEEALRGGAEATSSSTPRSRSRRRDELDDILNENLWTLEPDGEWSFVASRSDEVDIRKMSEEQRRMFEESDQIEWKAILDTKAVRVIKGEEAARVREKFPDRILDSRLVRRRKPLPGVGKWKAKSRWCLAGHTDPDTEILSAFAPTPSTEGLMAFCQTGLNLGHKFSFSDVKNAFCQSRKLRRARGPLYAKPCEGLGLEPGDLIVIEVPVYGLDDAPAEWRATVIEFLQEQGFVRNLIEPCWWARYRAGKNEAQVLIEVDDFIITALPDIRAGLRKDFEGRFKFGKWEDDEAEYAGRMVRVLHDRVLIDQKKYIEEQVHPVLLNKGRRSEKDSPLTQEEFEAFRSAIYKVNWIAKESRPEVCGMASILASKLKAATVEDVTILNTRTSTTCATPRADFRRTAPKELGWCFLQRLCPWETPRCELPLWPGEAASYRKVFSTFGGETQAMLQGISEADWLQVMIRDAIYHDVELREWRNCLSPHMLVMKGDVHLPSRQPQCSVTDAKSLFDCLLKEHPQGKQDRRSSLELAIIVRDLQETKSMVKWVPHQKMVVDALTKSDPMKANGALDQTAAEPQDRHVIVAQAGDLGGDKGRERDIGCADGGAGRVLCEGRERDIGCADGGRHTAHLSIARLVLAAEASSFRNFVSFMCEQNDPEQVLLKDIVGEFHVDDDKIIVDYSAVFTVYNVGLPQDCSVLPLAKMVVHMTSWLSELTAASSTESCLMSSTSGEHYEKCIMALAAAMEQEPVKVTHALRCARAAVCRQFSILVSLIQKNFESLYKAGPADELPFAGLWNASNPRRSEAKYAEVRKEVHDTTQALKAFLECEPSDSQHIVLSTIASSIGNATVAQAVFMKTGETRQGLVNRARAGVTKRGW
ncbi:GIP [Symbiodinium sp. CCMP2592]|nr:GIP [Symbiodinium sp. CCMP2592]